MMQFYSGPLMHFLSGVDSTTVAAASVFASMLFSPETRGTKMVSDIQLA
jgi:hypothetical protein